MIEVMIIEDDGIIRGLLKKMIEKNDGFRVVCEVAAAGEAAKSPHRGKPEAVSGIRQDKLVIKGREEIYFIDTDDIIYMERVNGSTRIVLDRGSCSTGMSLSGLYEKLDKAKFLRCHRSYIINLTKIVKLTQYGRWTYNVSFRGCDSSALMTYENYERLKQLL